VTKEVILNKNKASLAKNIKNDIVQMGPVYVKIGQIISTRTDVFPTYLTDAFCDLQNDVEAMGYGEVQTIFKSQFNKNINEHFSYFSEEPIAAASIGQVHVGRLNNKQNTKVAIKVLRTGIKHTFKKELLSIIHLLQLYGFVDKTNKNMSDMLSILNELYNSVDFETDFTKELDNMVIFKELLRDNSNFVVPSVYKPLSSEEVLTMEYVPSLKITDITENKELATELMKSFVLMVINDGYVHCDPHPGNLGVTKEGKIVLYDFGLVKKFDINIREYFRKIFMALVNRSSDELIDFMLSSGIIIAKESNGTNMEMLTGYETILLERMILYVFNYMNTLDIVELGSSINNDKYIDINDIPFEFDTQLIYLFKSFTTLEGVCKQLHEDFNYIDFVYEIVFEFVDMEMIMDKMAFDIQSSTVPKSQSVSNQTYTKMSIEQSVKRLESQNKKLILFLIFSVLFDLVIF
jgi:predicted unusual protein kinase regulating ubiquinone biosynthesis (AarF/ABC1/UbiB family)